MDQNVIQNCITAIQVINEADNKAELWDRLLNKDSGYDLKRETIDPDDLICFAVEVLERTGWLKEHDRIIKAPTADDKKAAAVLKHTLNCAPDDDVELNKDLAYAVTRLGGDPTLHPDNRPSIKIG